MKLKLSPTCEINLLDELDILHWKTRIIYVNAHLSNILPAAERALIALSVSLSESRAAILWTTCNAAFNCNIEVMMCWYLANDWILGTCTKHEVTMCSMSGSNASILETPKKSSSFCKINSTACILYQRRNLDTVQKQQSTCNLQQRNTAITYATYIQPGIQLLSIGTALHGL